MDTLRSRLPPPNCLVVFEAAARHLNFTRAADELSVTQAAVSRQVRILEEHIGRALFVRSDRRVALTPIGARLKEAVSIGLGHIADAVADIARRRTSLEVTVAASVSFSSYWLMSRVAQFRAQYPEINLSLVALTRARAAAGAEADLAIRYGTGEWPGMTAHHLFDNDIFPVCAPGYLADRRKPLRRVADLLGETLLHLSRFDRNWVSWEAWLSSFGVATAPRRPGLYYDNYVVLIHAVVAGQGIALCGGRLAQDMLARGDVVRPLKESLQSDRAFYLVHPADAPLNRAGQLFRDWLLAEARSAGRRSAD
jgi:LysR family glycine cleavage system transcriptional activator